LKYRRITARSDVGAAMSRGAIAIISLDRAYGDCGSSTAVSSTSEPFGGTAYSDAEEANSTPACPADQLVEEFRRLGHVVA
jgi:hypothetical protein